MQHVRRQLPYTEVVAAHHSCGNAVAKEFDSRRDQVALGHDARLQLLRVVALIFGDALRRADLLHAPGQRPHLLQQGIVAPRLLDEIRRAVLHSTHGQINIAPRGKRDDGHRAVQFAQALNQFQAFESRGAVALIVHVDHGQVGRVLSGRRQRLVGRSAQRDRIVMAAQQHGQGFAHMFLIFGDKDGRFVGRGSHYDLRR